MEDIIRQKTYKQFYMFKFESSRLDKTNYNFKLTFRQAFKNEEIVALGDNQLFRTIRRLKARETDNSSKFSLFMPEVISIVVQRPSHYKKLITKGLVINGNRFKRFLCGAGHARNNTVYFIQEDIYETVMEIFRNGHKDLPMNPAKYNAYFGLYASASQVVSTPKVVVIPDFKFNRTELVDWIEGDGVETLEKDLEFNAFDGQGLISPQMSNQWAEELGIDFLPSEFIIRAPFVKGMVATFDFHLFAQEHNINTITDIWEKEHNIQDIELILSESQFKLWSAYDSWDQYQKNCMMNKLEWSVTRTSPKNDKNTAFTNYQYIQTLDLSNQDIKDLCEPTVKWLKGVATDEDPLQAILFLLGEKTEENFYDILSTPNIDVAKSIILNNKILKHPHVKAKIANMIEKKVRDACMGKLAVTGNYSMMVADPYAQAEWAFKLEVNGLLKRDEYYNYYWLSKGIDLVDACRSPMTHYSEHNLLNLVDSRQIDSYYGYLNSGTVLNIWGNDCMKFADSDFDGDIIMSTNSPQFIKGVKPDLLPITYAKSSAPKEMINFDSCCRADFSSFDTKIGVITNYSTSLYCLERKHSGEKLQEIENRLKILRREQGNQIDKAKGIEITGFPTHWVKWSKINHSDSMEDKMRKEFNNDIIIEKKPYFMIYVYPQLKKEYQNWLSNMEDYAYKKYGMSVQMLKSLDEMTEDQYDFLRGYDKFIPVDTTMSTMNRLCKYMESVVFEINNWRKNTENVDSILKGKTVIGTTKLQKVKEIYVNYQKNKVYKHLLHSEEVLSAKDEIENIRLELLKIIRLEEFVDYCLEAGNQNFVWFIAPEEITLNVYNNRQERIWLPVQDEHGEFEYLNRRYRKEYVEI